MEAKLVINSLLALTFVISLIWLINFGLRRYGPEKIAHSFSSFKKNSSRRLKIIEILPVDARRRVVLLSRDGEEHLILLGANSETIIEKNIGKQRFRPKWQKN